MQMNSHGSISHRSRCRGVSIGGRQTDRLTDDFRVNGGLSLRLTMGRRFSCANMEMRTGVYANAQNVSHLGDGTEDLVATRKKELRWIQVRKVNKDSGESEILKRGGCV